MPPLMNVGAPIGGDGGGSVPAAASGMMQPGMSQQQIQQYRHQQQIAYQNQMRNSKSVFHTLVV